MCYWSKGSSSGQCRGGSSDQQGSGGSKHHCQRCNECSCDDCCCGEQAAHFHTEREREGERDREGESLPRNATTVVETDRSNPSNTTRGNTTQRTEPIRCCWQRTAADDKQQVPGPQAQWKKIRLVCTVSLADHVNTTSDRLYFVASQTPLSVHVHVGGMSSLQWLRKETNGGSVSTIVTSPIAPFWISRDTRHL